MNFKANNPVDISLVKEFVYTAKKDAFAGSGKKVTLNNQNSVFSFRGYGDENYKGDPKFASMVYTDEYSGNTVEAGTETVSIGLCNVWRNQYYGGSFLPYWTGEHVNALGIKSSKTITYLPFMTIEFLKMALKQLPADFPVRGPKYIEADKVVYEGFEYWAQWEYVNMWEQIPIYTTDDPFAAFQGKEIIKCNGTTVYWHGYQGGFLRDKYYPINLL